MSACEVCGKNVGFTNHKYSGGNSLYFETCNHCGAERLITYSAMDEDYDNDSEISE